MTIEERYEWACKDPDIGALIPVLRKYGEQCQHITEFGTRDGKSASAWLAAKPNKLVCYDIAHYPSVDDIEILAAWASIGFEFHRQNTANTWIDNTDLLFIDTVHNAGQVGQELLNRNQVSKFIIFHDTETYGMVGEGGAEGLWSCILPFLTANPVWKLLEVRPESNGLTVLQRICP